MANWVNRITEYFDYANDVSLVFSAPDIWGYFGLGQTFKTFNAEAYQLQQVVWCYAVALLPLADDQYAQWNLGTDPHLSTSSGVMVRADKDNQHAYRFSRESGVMRFYKIVSNVHTQLGSDINSNGSGQVGRLEAEGTTLRGFVAGSEVGSIVDATLSSGRTGIVGKRNSAFVIIGDDFEAGESEGDAPVGGVPRKFKVMSQHRNPRRSEV